MEQKKTLWIIAAVSVFLLVVFGGMMVILRKSPNNSPVLAKRPAIEKQAQSDTGWSNPLENPDSLINAENIQRPEVVSSKVNEMLVVSENTTVYDVTKPASSLQSTTIDLNTLKKELTAELAAQNQNPQNINITVTMPEKKEEVPVVVNTDYYAGKTKEEVPAKKQTTTVVKNTEKTEPPKNQKTVQQKPVEKPVVSTPKTVTRFWVQVAAYTNKKTAENAREVLSSNKISSDIFTYQDNKNRLFYRVRVGPYTTKSEAEYWQAKITKIADFSNAQSYVTSTTD